MYREDLQMPMKWRLLFALPVIVVAVALLAIMIVHPVRGAARAIIVGIIVLEALFTAGIILLFTQLSVVLGGGVLSVGFRAFRERIPLERITACAPLTYRWTEWGGYGIRVNRSGKMYNVPGDGGRAVQLTLDNGRRVCFSSGDPDAACAAIRGAKGGEGAGAGRW
jgi:hypothetical protein